MDVTRREILLYRNRKLGTFYINFNNDSGTLETVKFFDNTDTSQQLNTRYAFSTPLVADYRGTIFAINIGGTVVFTYTASGLGDSPSVVAAALTASGYGVWTTQSTASAVNFYCYSNIYTITFLRLRDLPAAGINYSPVITTAIGSSNVIVQGSSNLDQIVNGQLGHAYRIKGIWLYSSSDSQLLTPILFNKLQPNGRITARTITPMIDLSDPLPISVINVPNFELNNISNIQFDLAANTSVQMKFYYSDENLSTDVDNDNIPRPDITLIANDVKVRKWLQNKING